MPRTSKPKVVAEFFDPQSGQAIGRQPTACRLLASDKILQSAAKALQDRWQMPQPTARAIARAVLDVAHQHLLEARQ